MLHHIQRPGAPALLLAAFIILFSPATQADYARPAYDIVLAQEAFELRDYAEVLVVATQVTASRRDAAGDAFMRLARYIGGDNIAGMEIPMTAPVAQTRAAEDGDENWSIRFYLPGDMTADSAPAPTEAGVALLTLPSQRFASISFRGLQSDKKVAGKTAELKAFIVAQGYDVAGPPVYAFYDPPFIPWFLRDNEILLPVTRTPPTNR